MKKKEFILLIGLLVLVAVSPMDVQSASAASTGTPDDRYQALIGEWRAKYRIDFSHGTTLVTGGLRSWTWMHATLIIHEIDIANAKARCTFSAYSEAPAEARSMDNPVRADFIPLPLPKIKWELPSGQGQFEFVLKDNVLEGTISGWGYLRPKYAVITSLPPRPFKMEKQPSVLAPATGTPDDRSRALIGEWRGWFGDGGYCRLIIHEIDIANAKARCTYTLLYGGYGARSMDNPVRADFIPRPSPRIKWEIASGEAQFEFVLKDKVLEGTITGRGNLGPITFPVTIKMEKYLSASAPATGTPDDRYKALIGEWRGKYRIYYGTGANIQDWLWFHATLIIHEIDIANAKARCTFSAYTEAPDSRRSMDNPVRADFIPRPSPKFKWEIASGRGQFEFVLKDNVLEGTISGWRYLWPETAPDRLPRASVIQPSLTFKMEKQLKK